MFADLIFAMRDLVWDWPKALPLLPVTLKNPTISIGGSQIVFSVEMESGSYLEFHSLADCKLYGPNGELIREVVPVGNVPILQPGSNDVQFVCNSPEGVSARARVTVITHGKTL